MKNNLANLLLECEGCYKDRPVFLWHVDGRIKSVTYSEFLSDIGARQTYFRRLAEKRIGLWAYNSYEWVVTAIALLLEGKTLILLDANLEQEQLIPLCNYTDMELLVADDEMAEETDKIESHFRVVLLGQVADEAKQETVSNDIFQNGADGEFICFTSGTLKSAKGVVITAETLCGCVRTYKGLMGEHGERYYLPLPYHHIYAFVYIFRIIFYGKVHCIGQMGRYLLKDMETMKPEVLFCVPSILSYLLQKDYFPEQLKLIFTGGSYLRPELAEQILSKGIELRNLYGSSETLGAICSSGKELGVQWMKPVIGVSFLSGENSELGVFLPYRMKEYYKKAEDTCQVLDHDSMLYWTGDQCELNTDGYVKICGRVGDMIVLENGEKIHAEDTDAVLLKFPGVKEAATLCVQGMLAAVFYLEPYGEKEAVISAVKEYNKKRSTPTKIRKLWFRDEELPKTTTGKLKRAVLQKQYADQDGKEAE